MKSEEEPYVYIYIYIGRERERERESTHTHTRTRTHAHTHTAARKRRGVIRCEKLTLNNVSLLSLFVSSRSRSCDCFVGAARREGVCMFVC